VLKVGNSENSSSGKRNPVPLPSGESESARRVEQSIAYMMQHLDKPLRVATLAAQANVSSSYYFALFKRATGCAPMDYFIRLRMRHACRLLDTTSSSVKEIADALGYGDPFYFSRVFKSVNHVAPSEYRIRKKELGGKIGDRSFFRLRKSPPAGGGGGFPVQSHAAGAAGTGVAASGLKAAEKSGI
jgi:AraC-like DNA-binding protein